MRSLEEIIEKAFDDADQASAKGGPQAAENAGKLMGEGADMCARRESARSRRTPSQTAAPIREARPPHRWRGRRPTFSQPPGRPMRESVREAIEDAISASPAPPRRSASRLRASAANWKTPAANSSAARSIFPRKPAKAPRPCAVRSPTRSRRCRNSRRSLASRATAPKSANRASPAPARSRAACPRTGATTRAPRDPHPHRAPKPPAQRAPLRGSLEPAGCRACQEPRLGQRPVARRIPRGRTPLHRLRRQARRPSAIRAMSSNRSTRCRSTSPAPSITTPRSICGGAISAASAMSSPAGCTPSRVSRPSTRSRTSTAASRNSVDAVDRYIADFEKLLSDVARNDRDNMMTQTYLTSDTGKVYTMLAHASGRFGRD
jgi:hypothetical protein